MPVEASDYPADRDAGTLHLAVREGPKVVGSASLFVEGLPSGSPPIQCRPSERRSRAWRLRGMATAPEARGRGHGGALLLACMDHVAEQGGGVLWCNARAPAVGFYERYGLEVRSARFEVPGINAHYRMLAAIDPEAERQCRS